MASMAMYLPKIQLLGWIVKILFQVLISKIITDDKSLKTGLGRVVGQKTKFSHSDKTLKRLNKNWDR